MSFRYRKEAVGEAEAEIPQYGLVAEEVAPELVASDLEGRPYSVRYHLLVPMLVNEVKETERVNLESKATWRHSSARSTNSAARSMRCSRARTQALERELVARGGNLGQPRSAQSQVPIKKEGAQ